MPPPNARSPSTALGCSRHRRASHHGFTLVEVLVALTIMAVVAALAWRGIDGMVRAKEVSQAAMDRTMRLGTALAQWERDLQAVQPGAGTPPLSFDGASLRLTRESRDGIQLVVWTLRETALWRWASPPLTRASELQDQWMRSLQLVGAEPGTLRVLDDVQSLQVYFYRGNGWSNAQSSADLVQAPAVPASGAVPVAQEALPSGVRLQLTLPAGLLTRDVLLSGPGY
jgi:general secretion pathway protein J